MLLRNYFDKKIINSRFFIIIIFYLRLLYTDQHIIVLTQTVRFLSRLVKYYVNYNQQYCSLASNDTRLIRVYVK